MLKAQKRDDIILGALSLLLLAYVILRAYFLNLTHDEAHSYHSVKNFWHVQFLCTGNSHWINSLGMKCALLLGLENPLALRWFSIESFSLVLLLAFFWFRTLTPSYLKYAAFSFLFLNPYFIDYFSLARGYATAICLQALCLFCFIKGVQHGDRKFLLTSLICSGFSSIANFGFIYFYIAFAFIYFSVAYLKKGSQFFKEKQFYIDVLIALSILFLIIRAFVFLIRCSNDLIGAGSYTIGEMFRVFIDGQAYHKINFNYAELQLYGLFFFFVLLAVCIFGAFANNRQKNPLYFYCSLIILIIIAITSFNNLCFGVVFPYYRTALLLFIPVSISFFCFFDSLLKNLFLKKIVLLSTSLFLFLNFLSSLNLKFCFDFKEQADCKQAYACATADGASRVGISPEVYGVFYNYYSICKNYNYPFVGEMIETRFPVGTCPQKNKLSEYDHLILYPPYDMSYYKNSPLKIKVLQFFPTTGLTVVKVLK